jgi:hypothetical protein
MTLRAFPFLSLCLGVALMASGLFVSRAVAACNSTGCTAIAAPATCVGGGCNGIGSNGNNCKCKGNSPNCYCDG